jgi:hypothetical protein
VQLTVVAPNGKVAPEEGAQATVTGGCPPTADGRSNETCGSSLAIVATSRAAGQAIEGPGSGVGPVPPPQAVTAVNSSAGSAIRCRQGRGGVRVTEDMLSREGLERRLSRTRGSPRRARSRQKLWLSVSQVRLSDRRHSGYPERQPFYSFVAEVEDQRPPSSFNIRAA